MKLDQYRSIRNNDYSFILRGMDAMLNTKQAEGLLNEENNLTKTIMGIEEGWAEWGSQAI